MVFQLRTESRKSCYWYRSESAFHKKRGTKRGGCITKKMPNKAPEPTPTTPLPRANEKKNQAGRQTHRPHPSCLVQTKEESSEAMERKTEGRTSHAGRGRGSSLTL